MKIIRLVELVEEGITNHNDVFDVLDERNIRKSSLEHDNVEAYNVETGQSEKMFGRIFGKELSYGGGQMMFVSEKEYNGGKTFDMYLCDIIGNR